MHSLPERLQETHGGFDCSPMPSLVLGGSAECPGARTDG